MGETCCINCGDPDAEPYDLEIRNTNHREISLCGECHASIRRELSEAP